MKNVVIIGGGTGTSTLLSGLRQFPTNNSVIVSSADDGGSSGILRRDLAVMPLGDIRQCLLGLSYTDPLTEKLFAYRFEKGTLAGHSAGNIILAALQKASGNVEQSIAAAARMLNVRGQVMPVTLVPTRLIATLQNRQKIVGEHNIDKIRDNGDSPIRTLALTPATARANPRAIRAIEKSDVIVFGPGDIYTSTLPNLLVKGVAAAIKSSKAKKIMVINLMTKYGQSNHFRASDFVKTLEKYLKDKIDAVIVNTEKPKAAALAKYKKEMAELVQADMLVLKKMGLKVIAKPLLSQNKFVKDRSDILPRSMLRHDSEKIAKIIYELVS